MRKYIHSLIGLTFFWSASLFAEDLIDVYCQAVKCDPTFNAAFAELLANRENVPINRAALLPRLDIHGDAERQRIAFKGINFSSFQSTGIFIPIATSVTFYNTSINYYLKLTQPVFNFSSWASLNQAKASVKQAEATFCAAAQDLMVRVTRAYFDLMIADANLFYTQAHKKAVAEQLRETQEQFKVGVVPMTNVYEAAANYDLIVAEEVADHYNLDKSIEALRSITNHLYCKLKGLSAYLPLIIPEPANIEAWVCITEQQNYQLLAARFAALAARQHIKVKAGDYLPVINTFGEYMYTYDSNFQGTNILYREKLIEAGVEVDWSPIRGGGITARTIQAKYQYQQACLEQERTHREVVLNARNAYLGIFSDIAQVRADHAAIRSSQASLKATIESYQVGMRTILDVLNQQTQLYNAEKNFIRDRYEYIFQTVLLKQAAGTLRVADLQHINSWLYCTSVIRSSLPLSCGQPDRFVNVNACVPVPGFQTSSRKRVGKT
jgi:outer membrane protein